MRWVSFIPAPARRIVLRAAHYDHLPVLLTGDTGAGKSRIAEWIHRNGPRSTKPLVKLDPRQDVPSQIIGAAGASTVLFEDLHLWGGDHLSLLHHLVRSRSVTVDGVRHMIHARVIVTMAHGFEEASPLWDHFQAFHIHIPALATRPGEFEDIASSLLKEATLATGKSHLKGMDRLAWAKLKAHSWPGNVRELRDVIREAVMTCTGSWILASDLPDLHLRTGLRVDLKQGVEPAAAPELQLEPRVPG